jgi:hypothetical protein
MIQPDTAMSDTTTVPPHFLPPPFLLPPSLPPFLFLEVNIGFGNEWIGDKGGIEEALWRLKEEIVTDQDEGAFVVEGGAHRTFPPEGTFEGARCQARPLGSRVLARPRIGGEHCYQDG